MPEPEPKRHHVTAWLKRGRTQAGRLAPVRWVRSSLSARIALALTAAAVIVISCFAIIASAQLRTQVFESRRSQVLANASATFTAAQNSFDQSTASTPDQVQEVARSAAVAARGSDSGRGAPSVMLLRSPQASNSFRINDIFSSDIDSVLTDDMRRNVERSDGAYWQSVAIPDAEGGNVPGILTGTMVRLPSAGPHEMYLLYSLDPEQRVVDLLMRTLWAGSAPILILIPICSFWVLFRLLRPVRDTARAATTLAEGELDTRVHVQGHDEMARLGTAFNQMASSMQRQIAEYDRLSQLQQRFVSDVSHELRTPMTTIRMAEEMIYRSHDDFDEATARSAELLHGQVERMDVMLQDLLEISRYDAQSAVLEADVVDVRTLVTGVVEANEKLAATDHVEVIVNMPDHRCDAEVDARRITRVLRNFLVNALEHAEEKPVTVTVADTADAVAVRVRDHGVGMDQHTVAHAFDRFFRADPARTRTTGGTGLGLSIAHEDVDLHHGVIEAWGVPGRGASFMMVVPKVAGTVITTRPLELWEEE